MAEKREQDFNKGEKGRDKFPAKKKQVRQIGRTAVKGVKKK